MAKTFSTPSLESYRSAAKSMQDVLLANLVMIGEIPSPTFGEEQRIRFIEDRFSESGLQNSSSDELGNGFGVLPGVTGDRTLLVVAHADTLFDATVDHTLTVRDDRVIGPGVGDNGLGLAVLATLPMLLDSVGVRLQSNLILMAASRGLGRGNLEGIRFFLDHHQTPIHGAVCVEGVQLGRLSYSSIGMLRGEIKVHVPEAYDWSRFGAAGAVITLNDVINRINRIPLPKRPKTSIVLGSIEGGHAFSKIAHHSLLRFEIRSESGEVVNDIKDQIEDAIAEMRFETRAEVTLDIVAQRQPGGIEFRHPLVRCARDIMGRLGVEPRMAPSTSELAELIAHDIPAVTLGLTMGEHMGERVEEIMIEPMFTGIAQLLGMLQAMDEGEGSGDEH